MGCTTSSATFHHAENHWESRQRRAPLAKRLLQGRKKSSTFYTIQKHGTSQLFAKTALGAMLIKKPPQSLPSRPLTSVAPLPARRPMELETPALESKYQVDMFRIGKGHYSVVYSGKERATGKMVAIKKINKTMSKTVRLSVEIEILRKVKGHPNIVSLYDVYETPTQVQLVMELGECKD